MTNEAIGRELTPTTLITGWLAKVPEAVEEARTKGGVRERIAGITDPRGDAGAEVTPDERDELKRYLAERVKRDSDLQWLREDLAKYGSQYAPTEISDIGGFVAWCLTQVDWGAVDRFLRSHPAPDRAAQP